MHTHQTLSPLLLFLFHRVIPEYFICPRLTLATLCLVPRTWQFPPSLLSPMRDSGREVQGHVIRTMHISTCPGETRGFTTMPRNREILVFVHRAKQKTLFHWAYAKSITTFITFGIKFIRNNKENQEPLNSLIYVLCARPFPEGLDYKKTTTHLQDSLCGCEFLYIHYIIWSSEKNLINSS